MSNQNNCCNSNDCCNNGDCCNNDECLSRKVVVDASGHVVGKLASRVAKLLLEGYEVDVVACERAIFTGPLERHVGKYKDWKRKRCIVNPMRGAFHYKEPSKYFFKVLRTMVQRKTNRGGEALGKLGCYEAIPAQFVGVERVMFPEALHVVTNNVERRTCTIGQLLSKFGWKYVTLSDEIYSRAMKAEKEIKRRETERKEQLVESEEFKKKVRARLLELK
ncbi:RL13A [Enterospora canceri]|uniref:RL13A n=1 Tax=Enterospora canceri TaxID=1081671 RepID=A0A1Y1S6C5_9MICR|nr:RL13A [Enterospora canceri]